MFWRGWCFLAGLAPGALAVLAAAAPSKDPSWLAVQLGALAGGAALVLVASLLARRPHDEPDRGAHFARAASAGLVAWPAVGACLLGLAPGPRVLLPLVVAGLVLSFFAASRRRAPAGGFAGQLGAALVALVGGTAAVALLAGALAALRAVDVERDEAARNAVLDHDADLETVALPACAPRAARVEVLPVSGAHPRLADRGEALFFDAPGPDGRRQIHRLLRSTGEVDCLTCGEPGNNRHPAPGPEGRSVIFDTDRHASWRRPADTELQLLNVSGALRGVASRRITWSPGADERPLFAPAPSTLAWSRGAHGRYRVVSSGLVSGHGSLQVGRISTVHDGGAEWVAPLGWSPDARTLAVLRGNPLGPAGVEAVDPGTDRPVALGETASTPAALSFNADGGWYVLATARRARAAGLLPGFLGFALAPLLGSDDLRFQGTEVLAGATGRTPRPVDLGESADWGWPTGVALEPDGRGFVLGQRREGADGPDERLLAVRLDCS